MMVHLESLYHYRCDHCQNWWTIADIEPKDKIICPHCGKGNVILGIETHPVSIANKKAEQLGYPFEVYVVSSRSGDPSAEKIARERFFLVREDAETYARNSNESIGSSYYSTYRAILQIYNRPIEDRDEHSY